MPQTDLFEEKVDLEEVGHLFGLGDDIILDAVRSEPCMGFGRSSLESLILLEPDVVKIDKKWVNSIASTEGHERSLRRLQKVTNALGSELVAEGIETREDLDALVAIGVRFGQGYYLGRPA